MERKDSATTLVRVYELTATEEKALDALRKRATAKPLLRGQPWATEKEFAPVSSPQYRTKDGLVLTLRAPLEEVEKILANALNPKGRPLFSAVKFSDGTIEKIARRPDPIDTTKTEIVTTYRDNAKDEKHEEAEVVVSGDEDKVAPSAPIMTAADDKKEPVVAATVKQPVIGCPVPEFPEADVRATRALVAFLNEEQIADYKKHGAFVSVGHDTGHRYLVTNRETPIARRRITGAASPGYGQLYDLDEQRPLCVHDWDSPPPEECLTLHLCLAIPGYERYVRSLPHAW